MNDDLRTALDDLVGRSPIVLGRRGAVMNRIATVQRRRKVAVQAALSAFLVAAAATGANRVIFATPAGSDQLVQEPKPSVSEAPDPVPSAEPTRAPKKPREKHGPEPTKPPVVEPDPTHAPEPPREPVAEPTKTVAPLSVELYPYTTAKAGSEMDWKVKAYDGAGRLLRIELLFGDGQKLVYEPEEPCGYGVELKKLVSHVYAKAGTYAAHLSITTGGCGAETQTRTASSSVVVKPAATQEPTNSPADPTVSAEQVAGELATLALSGSDADGFVKKFYVDWGDGTESYVGPRSLDSCHNAEGTSHPAASTWNTQATHAYETPGTYTVTVTVMSVSCAVTGGQTAAVTLSVTV